MSLDNDLPARKPKRKPPNTYLPLATALSSFSDQQVLRFGDWCRLNGLSERTGRRILAGPNGPVVTKLSAKVLGITIAANRAWQQARVRAVKNELEVA
jgi:hypothetical protein